MPRPAPATIGDPLDRIDTPALIVDLDVFERNLRQPGLLARGRVRIRPHAKSHKSADIAKAQIAAGAVGVCCQKPGEAEALAEAGIGDILITNQVVGEGKLARLAALAGRVKLGVCVDDAVNAAALSDAVSRAGTALDVLVEIDVGQGRAGAEPGDEAVLLARVVDAAPGLTFAGLQAYCGSNQHVRSAASRREAVARSAEATALTIRALEDAGLPPKVVGGAGTGTFEMEIAGPWTELQPGSYVFLDADYARNAAPGGSLLDCSGHALFLLSTVMSHPAPRRLVLDAGHKAVSLDSGPPVPLTPPNARVTSLSDEHTVLDCPEGPDGLDLGDRVRLIPGHCDPTVNLHDWLVGVRGLDGPDPRVETLWPVTARGRYD